MGIKYVAMAKFLDNQSMLDMLATNYKQIIRGHDNNEVEGNILMTFCLHAHVVIAQIERG